MIQKFMLCPNLVLKNFYEQCGLEFKKTNINKKRLLDDLIELTNNDLEKEFKFPHLKKFHSSTSKIIYSPLRIKYLKTLNLRNTEFFF